MRRSPSTSGCSWWGRSACCSRSRARSAPCPASGPTRLDAAPSGRVRQTQPRELAKLEREVGLSTETAFDAYYRLRPTVRRVAAARLRLRGSRPRLAHGNRRVAARPGGLEPRPRRPGAAARPRRAGSGARPDRRRRRRRRSLVKVTEVADRSARLLDEVERAVVGKREALELVLLGLLADGHVLIEDFPGLAKTLIARSFAQATEPRLRPDPVHARPDALRRDRLVDLQPAHRRLRVPPRADLHQPPPRRRDQPRPAEDAGGAARGHAGAPGDDRGADAPARAAVPRARDPEPDRARGDLPAARGAARPVPAADLGRLPVPRATSSESSSSGATAASTRSSSTRSSTRPTLREMQRALEDVYVAESLGYYIVDVVRATRDAASVQVGASPRGTLAILKLSRAERRSTAATSSSRTTSRRWPARRSRTGSRSDPSSGCSRCAPRTSSPSGSRPSRPRRAEER